MKIDLVRKLTSRKFWLAITGFITPLLLAFGVSDAAATQITSIILSGASVIAYILAEGWVDANATDGSTPEEKTE